MVRPRSSRHGAEWLDLCLVGPHAPVRNSTPAHEPELGRSKSPFGVTGRLDDHRVIVNGSPRIRLEKLTRYMPPLLRKTRPDRRCSRRLLVPPQSCRSGKSIRGSGTKATRTNKSF